MAAATTFERIDAPDWPDAVAVAALARRQPDMEATPIYLRPPDAKRPDPATKLPHAS